MVPKYCDVCGEENDEKAKTCVRCTTEFGRRRFLSSLGFWLGFASGAGALLLAAIPLFLSLVLPSLMARPREAQRVRAKLDLVMLREAIELYAQRHGGQTPESLDVLVKADGSKQPILAGRVRLPLDPWQRPYGYERGSDPAQFRVYCLGRDGAPGGNGADADIDARALAFAR